MPAKKDKIRKVKGKQLKVGDIFWWFAPTEEHIYCGKFVVEDIKPDGDSTDSFIYASVLPGTGMDNSCKKDFEPYYKILINAKVGSHGEISNQRTIYKFSAEHLEAYLMPWEQPVNPPPKEEKKEEPKADTLKVELAKAEDEDIEPDLHDERRRVPIEELKPGDVFLFTWSFYGRDGHEECHGVFVVDHIEPGGKKLYAKPVPGEVNTCIEEFKYCPYMIVHHAIIGERGMLENDEVLYVFDTYAVPTVSYFPNYSVIDGEDLDMSKISCTKEELDAKTGGPADKTQEAVDHPSHYNTGKIEVIDYIDDQQLNFSLGNAVKYISRAGKKDKHKQIEDLEKAVWYINHEIERLKKDSKIS